MRGLKMRRIDPSWAGRSKIVDAGCIGKVISAEDRFEQILLEVEPFEDPAEGNGCKLIPLIEDIIVDIDEDDELITLECPKGLLDL